MICLKLAASASARRGGETGAAASIRATVGIFPATAAYLEESSQYLFSREFRHYLPLHQEHYRHTRTYSRKIAAAKGRELNNRSALMGCVNIILSEARHSFSSLMYPVDESAVSQCQ